MDKLPHLPTYQDNLAIFVGELRDLLFDSQEEAAGYFYLDRSRISRYESGQATPKLGYLAGLVQLLAERGGHEAEAQRYLLRQVNRVVETRHYRKPRFPDWEALCHTADTYLSAQQARQAAKATPAPSFASHMESEWQTKLEKRSNLPSAAQLIGVDSYLSRLSNLLVSPEAPWIICIDGLGGLGKTSLANALIRQPHIPNHFTDVAWVSAKQQNFLPGIGLVQASGPALNADALTDALLEQLDSRMSLSQPPHQKMTTLIELLKKAPYLIVIDNLETVDDYQSLLPTLLKLATPSKFLLTSRYSLRTHPDVFTLSVAELSRSHTIQFIRQEAAVKGLADVVNAPETKLQQIYQVVGGNPLALKLVVGQISVLSLPQVLENLKKAKGQKIEDLYTFVYWQAWHTLDEVSQKTFLLMPLAQDGTVQLLLQLTHFGIDELNHALQQLAELSLIQVGGTLEERRYTIHRLTETFLLNEAIAWKTSA